MTSLKGMGGESRQKYLDNHWVDNSQFPKGWTLTTDFSSGATSRLTFLGFMTVCHESSFDIWGGATPAGWRLRFEIYILFITHTHTHAQPQLYTRARCFNIYQEKATGNNSHLSSASGSLYTQVEKFPGTFEILIPGKNISLYPGDTSQRRQAHLIPGVLSRANAQTCLSCLYGTNYMLLELTWGYYCVQWQ